VGRYDAVSLGYENQSHSNAAYYNAGSAAIVLVLVIAALGTVFWCRIRRRRLRGLPIKKNEEENIPLTQNLHTAENEDSLDTSEFARRKGKQRAHEAEPSRIFDVGDLDEEAGDHSQ
jgi:carboxypeptidase D